MEINVDERQGQLHHLGEHTCLSDEYCNLLVIPSERLAQV